MDINRRFVRGTILLCCVTDRPLRVLLSYLPSTTSRPGLWRKSQPHSLVRMLSIPACDRYRRSIKRDTRRRRLTAARDDDTPFSLRPKTSRWNTTIIIIIIIATRFVVALLGRVQWQSDRGRWTCYKDATTVLLLG